MKLGICMDGGEEVFLMTVRDALRNAACAPAYLEIGLAYGETFKGVIDFTRDLNPSLYGIDLPTWEAWEEIRRKAVSEPHVTLIEGRSSEVLATWPGPHLSAVFIDACHGEACVMVDFLGVEPWVAPGGIVIFHDAGEAEQGSSFQPHCGEPINVRSALNKLGLFTNQRAGWSFEGMLPTMNQCAVFRKGGDSNAA